MQSRSLYSNISEDSSSCTTTAAAIDLPVNWKARINLNDSATSFESILACSLSKKSNLDENFVLHWILKDEAINC